jgi:hypothetical protein
MDAAATTLTQPAALRRSAVAGPRHPVDTAQTARDHSPGAQFVHYRRVFAPDGCRG